MEASSPTRSLNSPDAPVESGYHPTAVTNVVNDVDANATNGDEYQQADVTDNVINTERTVTDDKPLRPLADVMSRPTDSANDWDNLDAVPSSAPSSSPDAIGTNIDDYERRLRGKRFPPKYELREVIE